MLQRLKPYLPEFVYGGIDGSITTFAVVAGASGADLSAGIVIILGLANLIADGFSMSVGNYLSTRAEQDSYHKHQKQEQWEIEHQPAEEIEEIRQIYRKKGFEGELLEQVVTVITADRARWIDTMMKEELEMMPSGKAPFSTALMTFAAFITVGLIPLLIYLVNYFSGVDSENEFLISSILTSLAFVLIGFLKSYVNEVNRLKGMLETLALGGVAAALAYYVGFFLEKMVGVA